MSSAVDVAKLIAETELDSYQPPAYTTTSAGSLPALAATNDASLPALLSTGAAGKLRGSRIDATLMVHDRKVPKQVMDDVNNWTLWARRAANAHIKKNPGAGKKECSRLEIAGVNVIQQDSGKFRAMPVTSTVKDLVLNDIKTVSPSQVEDIRKLVDLYREEHHKSRWILFNDYAKLGDTEKEHFNLGANTVDEFDSAIFSGGYYQFDMGSTEIDYWLWSTSMSHINFNMGRSVFKLTKERANHARDAILKALGDSIIDRIDNEDLD